MSDDDGRNGSRPSFHPEALEELTRDIASKQTADERWITAIDERTKRIDDALDEFRQGETEWQMAMTRQMQRIVDKLNALMVARLALPSIVVCLVLYIGSMSGMILYQLAKSH
jgi:hypothetical protein